MKNNKKRVLVIVAHPDDEVIWMGGTLIANKDAWNTTIISLCRKNDPDRAPKFHNVCKTLGARGFISDLDDSENGDLMPVSNQDIISRIIEIIKNSEKDYDYIFTHGENGEYGHPRHIEVHNAVKKMLQNNQLKGKTVFFFNYKKRGKYCYPQIVKNPKEKKHKIIKLKNSAFIIKKELIRKSYGFGLGGFEEISCRDCESFRISE